MADYSELSDRLGPGTVAATRPVVFKCAWPGKKQLLMGNFVIDKDASESDMRVKAEALLRQHTLDHYPDGIDPPELLEVVPGALRWIPDEDYYGRKR